MIVCLDLEGLSKAFVKHTVQNQELGKSQNLNSGLSTVTSMYTLYIPASVSLFMLFPVQECFSHNLCILNPTSAPDSGLRWPPPGTV